MGCYATRDPQAVAALPGVVEVVTDKRRLPELLARLGLVDVPRGISQFGREHRAYVKVQDGCQMKCAFCIIPSVRPTLSSRPVADVLAEARRLVANGYRELVLTGIHLGHYGAVGNALRGVPGVGKDVQASPTECHSAARHGGRSLQGYGALGDLLPATDFSPASPHPNPLPEGEGDGNRLADLVRRLADMEGEFRLRLSSLEAAEVTPELVDVLAGHPEKVCPHLHISLQSGSDSVLARMRRRGDSRQMLRRCRSIREKLDTPALTTDIIVGFPGETDAEFQETCRVVEEIGFSKVHVFRFSPREGTPAARMPEQVPPPVKHQRAKVLIELADRLRQEYLEAAAGPDGPGVGGSPGAARKRGTVPLCAKHPPGRSVQGGLSPFRGRASPRNLRPLCGRRIGGAGGVGRAADVGGCRSCGRGPAIRSSPDYSRAHRNPKRKRGRLRDLSSLTLRVSIAALRRLHRGA